MDKLKIKRQKLAMRHRRIRGKISGTAVRPRLLVFRSHRHIYGQLIDDEKGKTLVSAKDSEIKSKKMKKGDLAKEVGMLLAKKALEAKIKEIVFDRRGYKFHGRVKQLAEGARSGGLKF
jgi:large subunit ribosomal protein L18